MKLGDIALAFILGCVIAFLVYIAWTSLALGDEESANPACQTEIYELFIGGIKVQGFPDMDALECDLAAGEVGDQTPPFTPIECKPRYTCRQEL